MAEIDYFGYDDQHREPEPVPYVAPTSAPAQADNPRDAIIARDSGSWEQQLREMGGSLYDPTDLQGVIRQVSYAQNAGRDPADFLEEQRRIYDARRIDDGPSSAPSRSGMPSPQTTSTYAGVFSDPLTKQYESLLQAQLGLYQQQQAAMQQAAQAAEQRRAATADAVKRMEAYMNQRVGQLQGPAYTGPEAEVLRTRLLDPLERDRTAAQRRALEQIGARGMDPSSGIAQQLLKDVNRYFDEARTREQGGFAQRQIEEERSRGQEAQQLLQYLAMLPDAQARGDLDFVAYLQNLIAHPGTQGLAVGQAMADLPGQRLNEALAALGIAPPISGANNSVAQLLQLLQSNRFQNQQGWQNFGLSFGL